MQVTSDIDEPFKQPVPLDNDAFIGKQNILINLTLSNNTIQILCVILFRP